MNLGYQMYQAERPLSCSELRVIDASRGEIARILSHLLHPRHLHPSHTAPGHQGDYPHGEITVPDYLPKEWMPCGPAASR
jgi:hypothetical protein